MEGQAEASGRPSAPHGNIGAADTFVGNLHRGMGQDGKDALGGEVSELDIADMSEDRYYNMLGRKRGFLEALARSRRVTPRTLILVRHDESVWNANKDFTGWADPDLSLQGHQEVELKRAIRTAFLLLRELDEVHFPVFKS